MKKKRVALALSQSFLLILSIVAISFMIGSELESVSAQAPSLKNIPGGRSTNPHSNQIVKELAGMSPEEVSETYSNIQAKVSRVSIPGPGKKLFDLTFMIALVGGGTVATLGGSSAVGMLSGVSGIIGNLATIGPYAVVAVAALAGGQIVKLIFALAGASDRNLASSSTGALIGAGVGAAVASIALALSPLMTAGPAGWIAFIAAVIVTAIWTAFSYQDYSREIFTYKPGLWQPIEGGERCGECNILPYGCSEYQCRSYGTGCELINPDSVKQKCIWLNKDDITPPTITPMDKSLLSDDYKYTKTSQGTKLTYKGGCLPAFKGVTFGVQTNKPSQCRYDTSRKFKFSDMAHATNFGITAYLEKHRVAFSNSAFPSQYAAKDLGMNFKNGEEQEIYFMCKSVNGFPAPKPFLLTFCIDDSPDLTATEIMGSTPTTNTYIRSGVSNISFEIYTNEAANCSWDFKDIAYDTMAYPMYNCSQNFADYKFKSSGRGCFGNLTGIKADVDNRYYIRCKDKPTLNLSDPDQKEKNIVNEESYVINLIGTRELVLDKVIINGEESGAILKDSIDPMKIKIEALTSQGAEKNGNARCSYTTQGIDLINEFTNKQSFEFTSTNIHETRRFKGVYKYLVTCHDKAGNIASKELNFTIEIDTSAPMVVRISKDEGKMKIITNEYAKCYYGTDGCNFVIKEGTPLTTYDHLKHTTEWVTDMDKYIKCEDKFGNPPSVTKCSTIVRGHKA